MRPQKRQRKRVILDSDDDSEKPSSQASTASAAKGKPKSNGTTKVRASQRPNQSRAGSAPRRTKASSLHTFFNARTQAQGAGSLQSSGTPTADEDVLDVDEIEEDEEELGKGSTRGKRKFTPVLKRQESDENAESSRPSSARWKKGLKDTADSTSNGTSRTPAITPQKPWVDLFPPLDREELAVHKKKVSDVDEWLRSASTGHHYRRLLVLKGPAGSGKTATVSTLAKERNLRLVEWSNPSSTAYGDDDFQSASTQFEDFLGRSAPFASLEFKDSASRDLDPATETDGGRITMVEEVHVIARWSNALIRFRETIMMHLSSPISNPVVIILSEEDNTSSNAVETMTAHSLLGPDVLQHPAVSVIEFNPVAPTFVSNALDLVIKKEARLSGRRRIPGPSLLRALAETGDIRSAIGMLEMMCLNEDDETLSGRVAAKGTKASRTKTPLTAAEQATLNAISQRESSLGLFHAVGKVVYNRREDQAQEQPPSFMPEHARRLTSVVDTEDLFAHAATDVDTFVAALHENYALSCEAEDSLSHIEACLENLSDADVMASFDPVKGSFGSGRRYFQGSTAVDESRHVEMVFNTAVRGVLFSLPFPVKRKTKGGFGHDDPYKMQYPNSVRLRRRVLDTQDRLAEYIFRDASNDPNTVNTTFRARPSRNGVESWASSWSKFDPAAKVPVIETFEPAESRAVRKLDKNELVAVQLPYVAMIAAAAKYRARSVAVPEELVRFTTLSGGQIPSWKQSQGLGGKGNGNASRPSAANLESVEKLVLSDDDIEDD